MLQDFLVNHYVGGPNGVDNPAIDGLFIDDDWSTNGPSEEDKNAVADMGLSANEVEDIIQGWQSNMAAVQVCFISEHH